MTSGGTMNCRHPIVAVMAACAFVLMGCGRTTTEQSTAHANQPPADSTDAHGDATAGATPGSAAAPNAATPDAHGTADGSHAAAGTLDRSPSPSDLNPGAAPDNTGANTGVNSNASPTAVEQSHSPADLDLTRRIRQAVQDDHTLTASGQNVTIVARDGKVTLRGPVKDANEKKAIGDKASTIAGPGNVDNQLEIPR
jgi:hyperosmotically inducible periplasmic protein